MRAENEDWESELWSFVHAGDGKDCPGVVSCQSEKNGSGCFNNEIQRAKNRAMHLFLDSDEVDLSRAWEIPRVTVCSHREKIFELVRKLSRKYRNKEWNGLLPVPDNLIISSPDGVPIEVRKVALKANHGAVWRMDDAWLIHLNSASSPARQRLTLYHEVFHILAHSKGDTSFKHSENHDVYFFEFLADHFAADILTPKDIVRARWQEVQDVIKMAQLFSIPAPIMYGIIRNMGLLPTK